MQVRDCPHGVIALAPSRPVMFVSAELLVGGQHCDHLRPVMVLQPVHTHTESSVANALPHSIAKGPPATGHACPWGCAVPGRLLPQRAHVWPAGCCEARVIQDSLIQHNTTTLGLHGTMFAAPTTFGAQQLRPLQGLGHSTWPACLQAFCGNIVRWQQGLGALPPTGHCSVWPTKRCMSCE